MKKTLLIAAIAGLAFASCKKEYSCKCTVTTTTAGITTTTTATGKTEKMSKKDAKAKCDEGDSSTDLLGVKVVSACEIE